MSGEPISLTRAGNLVRPWPAGALDRLGTVLLAAVAIFSLVMSVAFFEVITTSRLLLVLLPLCTWQVLVSPRLFFSREMTLYGVFTAYLFLTMIWTVDKELALNTLFPVVDFLLIMILFASLMAYHERRAVIQGVMLGFLAGVALYSAVTGFPLSIPVGFSYNAMASLYLFGIFASLLYAWVTRRRLLPTLLALIFLLLVMATTSIKTNLGILVGAGVAVVCYPRMFAEALRRQLVPVLALLSLLAYGVLSNPALQERLEYGVSRVSAGIRVLQAREDVEGYTGFTERAEWLSEGLQGWKQNPLFGQGVEALRDRLGVTSHSTPMDVAYNSGLIGLILFYSLFVSMIIRLWRIRDPGADILAPLLVGILTCNFLVSLGAIAHYSAFLAATLGLSLPILQSAGQASGEPA